MRTPLDEIEDWTCQACGRDAEEDGARTECASGEFICGECFEHHWQDCNTCARLVAEALDD